jgi:lactate dehydrogenase-like 2-hydroxyacid dehydrogenase
VEEALGAERMELDAALSSADVVSLHAPATSETHHLIGEHELDLIGPGGVLVNTSRGSLVDAEALAAALREERLGAAGLDVYENEPEVPPALLEAPRCVLLPHIGSATVRARRGMARLAAENVIAVLSGGEPKTPVS